MSKVAAILCNYNDSRFLMGVIHEIARQKPDEFIVVDDRSTDRSRELLKHLQKLYHFKVIKNDGAHSPFGSFVAGCKAAKSEYVACFSADDYPNPGYLDCMRWAIDRFPMVKVYTCNTLVEREGEVYKRTLFPWTAYISPDYAVKIFQAGFAKNINQCGIVVDREWVLGCWEWGGNETTACFDCMYSFLSIFDLGFINIGEYLTTYRSYPAGWGAMTGNKAIKQATKVHKRFAKPEVYKRAMDSGMWNTGTRWKALIALWGIMKLPKWARKKFYNWFYSYDQRVEKL